MVGTKIIYYAPNPPTYNSSFSGSALPFPNPDIAFEGTPNHGAVNTKEDISFEFRIFYPNSYYIALGTVYVGPHVFIKGCGVKKVHSIYLGDGVPFRMVTYPSPPYTLHQGTHLCFIQKAADKWNQQEHKNKY